MALSDIGPAIGVNRRLRPMWAKVTWGAAVAVTAVAALGVGAGAAVALFAPAASAQTAYAPAQPAVGNLLLQNGEGYWPEPPAPGPEPRPRFCAGEPDGQPAPPPFYDQCLPKAFGTLY